MISDARLLEFCRSLETALRSGLPLGPTFETLSRDRRFAAALGGAAVLTAAGSSIHAALAAQKIYPPVFLALMRAGEEGGKLDDFLALYAGGLEAKLDFRRRLRGVLIYPAFAAALAVGVLAFISLKALPELVVPGTALTGPAAWFTAAAAWLGSNWLTLTGGLAAALVVLSFLARTAPGRKAFALAARLPLLRLGFEEARLRDIYSTMAMLLKAGLPPSAMMDIMLQYADDDPPLRRGFARAASQLAGGVTFCAGLAAVIPAEDLAALELAEKAGRLEDTFNRLARLHFDRHIDRLKTLTTVFKIGATVALAPLCYMLLMSIIKPVLSSLNTIAPTVSAPGGPILETQPAPAAQPQQAAPAPTAGTIRQEATEEEESARQRATAEFNAMQGGKIAAILGGAKVPKASLSTGPASSGTAAPAKKLAPVQPVKTPPMNGFGSRQSGGGQ